MDQKYGTGSWNIGNGLAITNSGWHSRNGVNLARRYQVVHVPAVPGTRFGAIVREQWRVGPDYPENQLNSMSEADLEAQATAEDVIAALDASGSSQYVDVALLYYGEYLVGETRRLQWKTIIRDRGELRHDLQQLIDNPTYQFRINDYHWRLMEDYSQRTRLGVRVQNAQAWSIGPTKGYE